MKWFKLIKSEEVYQFHQELNSKIWDGFSLKKEVKNKLLLIAKSFIDFMEIDYKAIKDIIIMGSSANYNYTKYSDLDLHLLVDYEKIHKDCPIVTNYLWASKALFNKEHDITINNIPVELYAQNYRDKIVSNGIYSLIGDKWISKPKQIEKINVDDTAFKIKRKFLLEEINHLIENKVDGLSIQEMIDKLYRMRKNGLESGGEFSTENILFKSIRNSGLLEKLKKIKQSKEDEKLSL